MRYGIKAVIRQRKKRGLGIAPVIEKLCKRLTAHVSYKRARRKGPLSRATSALTIQAR